MSYLKQLNYLRTHILALPYAERESANELLRRWDKVQRLSQLEQLRLDKLIDSINAAYAKTHPLLNGGNDDRSN